jgi:hypothetical protein
LISIAAIALTWIIVDMIQHWEDWRDVVLLMLGPIGMIILLIETLSEKWNSISSAFRNGGIKAGIIAIGDALKDRVLSVLNKILNIAGRLPRFLGGGYFKSLAADIKEVNSPKYATVGTAASAVNNLTTFGGTLAPLAPFSSAPKAQNLAGNNNKFQQDVMAGLRNGLGGALSINLNDPAGLVKEVDDSQVKGIPVKLTKNQGSK